MENQPQQNEQISDQEMINAQHEPFKTSNPLNIIGNFLDYDEILASQPVSTYTPSIIYAPAKDKSLPWRAGFRHDKMIPRLIKDQKDVESIPNYYVTIKDRVIRFYFSYDDYEEHRKISKGGNYFRKRCVYFHEAITFYEDQARFNKCEYTVQEIKDEFKSEYERKQKQASKQPGAMW